MNEEGANVVRANALHCAAICPAAAPFVNLLCALGGPGAINGRDPHGNTPLMVCAGTIAGMGNASHRPDTSMLRSLVAAGADTSARDDQGRTSLEIYRATVSEFDDIFSSMGVSGVSRRDAQIEGLLMPASN